MVKATLEQKRFQEAMRKSPQRLFANCRTEIRNHHLRFAKRVATTRMSGRPGLKAPTGTMRRGLIAGGAVVRGNDLRTLEVRTIFTGPHGHIARWHEEGTNAKHIPPRLEFKKTWDAMRPGLNEAVQTAVANALAGRGPAR